MKCKFSQDDLRCAAIHYASVRNQLRSLSCRETGAMQLTQTYNTRINATKNQPT